MRRFFIFSVLLFLMLSIGLCADVPLNSVDTEQLEEVLPQGWVISQVVVVDSPAGWETTKGGRGLQVSFGNPTCTVHDSMVGDYHPTYSFTLMPRNWEGKNLLGGIFVAGLYTKKISDLEQQVYPDRYRKTFQAFHYFESYLGRGDWIDPCKDITPLFEHQHEVSNPMLDQ